MGGPCEDCRFKCPTKVNEEDRQKIFSSFWAMGDHTRQQDYIKDHILRKDPAVHFPDSKHKQNTIKYFFVIDGKMTFVCKTMFLQTFSISEAWTKTVVKKLKAGNGHVISPDMRGRHNKVAPEVHQKNTENVEEHIKLFKAVPSHFCRAKSQRKYLPTTLNISKMYRLYRVWMSKVKPNDQVKAETFYRSVFNTKFNLGFHKPKKDMCDMCSVFDLCNAAQKAKLQEKFDMHLKHKNDAKVARKADREYAQEKKDTVCYAIYDLQKTLCVPNLDIGEVYYKRKLSMYNFTIYNVIEHQGFCYTWNESEARKGANEIATSVLLFIEMMANRGVKEIIFWSDNCSGQNKNKYLFSMYTHACAKYKIKIIHRYMEKGHTMNEADSMHARIERFSKFKSVYEPFDWIDIIKNCKVNGNKYELTEVGGQILDFHPLADKYQKWTHQKAKWRSVREIIIDSETPGKVMLRHDLGNPQQMEIKITCKVGRPINLNSFKFQHAYNSPLELDKNKLKDLASMCNDLIIPSNKHAFYLGLVNFPDLSNPLALMDESEDEGNVEDVGNDNNEDFNWETDSENEESDYEEQLQNLQRPRGRQEILSEESDNESENVDDVDGNDEAEQGKENKANESDNFEYNL
ncbi:uncharacterized protein LOC127749229 [Frankliniella occidentalis]|uniref:Uncharacterized protein LOC127749229 n=1 Tax=Frankliniella occidentalis TaxID=133901 RepID=A0A9C6U7D9_FRAOC|nr:uncharacterized protein LOC127749229 [Frankliniella occidentalis]